MNYLSLIAIFFSMSANADDFSERIKITGFRCEHGKAGIHLRALETDRTLYLVKNPEGEPQYLEMTDEHCQGLIKHLSGKLAGKVLNLDFHTEIFSRNVKIYVPPRNPCRPGRTKCDDEGDYVERTFTYLRTETTIDDYRFANEERLEQ